MVRSCDEDRKEDLGSPGKFEGGWEERNLPWTIFNSQAKWEVQMYNIIAFAAEVLVLERKSKKSIHSCLFFFLESWKFDHFPVVFVFIFFNNAVPELSLLLFEKVSK